MVATTTTAASPPERIGVNPIASYRNTKMEVLRHLYQYTLEVVSDDDPTPRNATSIAKSVFRTLHRNNTALQTLVKKFKLEDLNYIDSSDALHDEMMVSFCVYICAAVIADITEECERAGMDSDVTFSDWMDGLGFDFEIDALLVDSTVAPPGDDVGGADSAKPQYTWPFENRVLSMMETHNNAPLLHELQDCVDGPDAVNQYHQQWIPYILEEVRAAIDEQLTLIRQQRPPTFHLHRKGAHKSISDTTVHFTCTTTELPKIEHFFALEAIFLRPKGAAPDATPIFAIASKLYFDDSNKRHVLGIRVLKSTFLEHKGLIEYTSNWEAQHLAGLISFNRMFDACRWPSQPAFLDQIITGSLPAWPKLDLVTQLAVSTVDNALNDSQRFAVRSFCDAEDGFYCLQGPPGTGKTTTAVNALSVLCENDATRVLVCAASNKAVRVLAKRTATKYPSLRIALTGTNKDVPKELQRFFVYEHTEHIRKDLVAQFQPISNAHDELMDFGKRSKRSKVHLHRSQISREQADTLLTAMHHHRKHLAKIADEPCSFSLEQDAVNAVRLLCNKFAVVEEMLPQLVAEYNSAANDFKPIRKKMSSAPKGIPGTAEYSQFKKIQMEISKPSERINAEFAKLSGLFYSLCSELKSAAENVEILLVQRAQVLFCTLVSSGRPWLSKHIDRFDVVIVDEASQCTVPESLIPLKFRPTKLLHIGDPRQLPATIKSKSAKQKGYGDSLMLRMMEKRSQPYHVLNVQYRMHPAIWKFSRNRYYAGQPSSAQHLRSRPSPLAQADVDDVFKHPTIFCNVASGDEQRNVDYSKSIMNAQECRAIMATLAHLLPHLKGRSVGVIAFYAAQVTALKKAFKRLRCRNKPSVTISTVDGFQGEEKDVILLSMVRSSTDIGFLKDTRRLNVAITRPRHHLLVFGKHMTLKQSQSDVGLLADMFSSATNAEYRLFESRPQLTGL